MFYLNVVGYKVESYRHHQNLYLWFYLNVVGYKAISRNYG
ncbi:hypothetical protein HMPREF0083_02413 [Aneurinibacillus aneurinilyticus ATCC 12856]|uniref:Uncharacterized protein n=1 Tax=Aneurinibacillus aneurinilyticus ATCC 12856 TaxID=649747 RepID=U1YBT9_ANEAE|nr:hypothetical protein HMPREF0083_02413 [Aneurinibacillus aneurinilyticus ATCC 12856]